jgi:hypothetical protein
MVTSTKRYVAPTSARYVVPPEVSNVYTRRALSTAMVAATSNDVGASGAPVTVAGVWPPAPAVAGSLLTVQAARQSAVARAGTERKSVECFMMISGDTGLLVVAKKKSRRVRGAAPVLDSARPQG